MSEILFIVNVEVAILRNGRYLATTRALAEDYGAGWAGFPGGKLEAGDQEMGALERAARREVLEEVGLELDGSVAYVESHLFTIGSQPVLDIVMLARSSDGEPHIASEDEVSQVEWLTFDAMMAHPAVQTWTRASLELAEAKRQELGW